MNKEKVKETMIDVYGVTIFLSAWAMIITALGLTLMSVIYITNGDIIQPVVSALIAGVLIYYSIILMKQVKIDPGG